MLYVDRCNWINQNGVQCGLPLGHKELHGIAFLTTLPGEWHEFIEERPVRPRLEQPFGCVWIDKSVNGRCLWRGAYGPCIYEIGHTIAHREEAKYHNATVLDSGPQARSNSAHSSALRTASSRPQTAR
jgi:hypothetical protein